MIKQLLMKWFNLTEHPKQGEMCLNQYGQIYYFSQTKIVSLRHTPGVSTMLELECVAVTSDEKENTKQG